MPVESFANAAFRRNLEPAGDERTVGRWAVTGYVDLLSERRFLLSSIRSPAINQLEPGVVAFRLAAASTIAPDIIAGVVDVVHNDTRLEILSAYRSRFDTSVMDDSTLRRAAGELVDALAYFERYCFECSGLCPDALAVDDDGALCILPLAIALPAAIEGEIDGRGGIENGDGGAWRRRHLERIAVTMRAMAAASSCAFAAALDDTASAIDRGQVTTLDALSRRLFGRGLEADHRPLSEPAAQPDSPVTVDADALDAPRVIEVTGAAGSGRSATLSAIEAAYAAAGAHPARVDAWSFAERPRRKSAAREEPWTQRVWIVDDIEDQQVIHPQILAHVSGRTGEPGALIYAVGDHAAPAAAAFLHTLRSHAANDVESVRAQAGAPAPLDTDGAATLLDTLGTDARQILELACVAGMALPFQLVLAALSNPDGAPHATLHELAGMGLVAVDYRRRPAGGPLTVMVRVPAASVRRAVRECLPEERRRNLHRTVARLAAAHGGFPAMSVYRHLMLGDEPHTAAAHAVSFIRASGRDERAPFLDGLVRHMSDDESVGQLSYGDRLFALNRLGSDLFTTGRRAEAEQLLLSTRDLEAEYEDVQSHAALYADTMRLLSDTWAARGNYTQALELLTDTREFLGPHLSLAEQAQLMNEIGWLQYRLGDYETSVDSCKLSLTTLNPNEHPAVVAQALNLMGVIHFNTSRYDEAIGYYERAAFLREKVDARDALAGSYNNLALAYQAKGEYDKALGYYDKSFEIKRQVNNEAGLAAGYLNQALLYLEIHSFDEAEKMCRESLEISTHLGLEQLTAEIHNTLGDVEEKRGHLDEAEACYRRAIDMASSLETINEEMGARRRLARLYLTLERHADAREQIENASRLGAQIGSKYETAQISSILGDLCVAEEHNAEAIEHYEKAASAYATVSKYRHAATALANIGLVHAGAGNPLEAKHYLDRALDLIKSEIGHETPDEIVTLQQALRERPVRTSLAATESQKLLYAFYELSSLAEFAEDKTSFFKRAIATLQELTGAHACMLAVVSSDGAFVGVREGGEQEPIVDPGMRALLARTLQLGALLHSASPEVGDVIEDIRLPGDPRAAGIICVPMKSMGQNLGCVILQVASAALPLSKEETNFITSVARHIAGDLRLTLHLEEHANKEKTLETEFESLKAQVVDRYKFANMIGKDESMKKVFRIIEKVKDMDTGILIIGESGTGKTELARTIHYNSPRRKRPFQEIHCAEIPAELLESELWGHEKGSFTGAVKRKLGRCEVADGGTVFLDDVNVVPPKIQAKLLHYLESKSFMRLGGTQTISTDVRIIASSNEDLEQLVKTGGFREDLYYRLKVIQVELPPLRDRRDDMMAIAQEFLKRRCAQQGKPLKTLSSETIKLFQRYPWPGNVRELQNVLEQIVLLADDDIVDPSSLPEDFLKRATGSTRHGRQSLQALARQIVEMESYSEGNPLMPQLEAILAREMAQYVDSKTKAASMLGITKPTLYNRLRNYDKMS